MNPLAANSQNILPRVVVSSYLIFCGVYQAEGAAFQNLELGMSPSAAQTTARQCVFSVGSRKRGPIPDNAPFVRLTLLGATF